MLAIAGGKGGTGKTTTALALGDALRGTPLVVDADREMPNLHALAGVPREPTLGDAAGGDPPAPSPADYDCRLLPAPARDDPPTDRLLARVASDRPDSRPTGVLVDCPAGAAPDAVAPLRVAEGVLLVAPPCAAALRDTAKTAATARALETPVVGAVLTRARLVPDGVASLLGCPVLGSVPPAAPGTDPLSDGGVRRAYADLAGRIDDAVSRACDV